MGKCLQTYDLRRGLNLVFLTRPEPPARITATYAWKGLVFAAWGGEATSDWAGIWIFQRGRLVGELPIPQGLTEPITCLSVVGRWIIATTSSSLQIWTSSTYEPHVTLYATRSISGGKGQFTGHLCSIPTFMNKILVGKSDGSVEMWNISIGKLVHTFLPPKPLSGSVTALEAAPALGSVACARSNGSLLIHDITTDRVILELDCRSQNIGNVTSISFRTDGLGAGDDGKEAGIMATASADSGDITFWDLNNAGRISGILRGAHNPPSLKHGGVAGGVNKIEFLAGQAIMISSGLDNALKSWIFDDVSTSNTPRILHARGGHAAPITRLSFIAPGSSDSDATGKWLMSASQDRSLWAWSLRRDGQSTELSQGNVQRKAKKLGLHGKNSETDTAQGFDDLKAPEITCVASSMNRDGGMGASSGGGTVWSNTNNKKGSSDANESSATGWESVLTGHRGDKYARTWFWGRKKAGRWAFETVDGTEVTSVAITACGTFAIVGSAGGAIASFNLQSGFQRQRFPAPITPAQAKKIGEHPSKHPPGTGKHSKAISGVTVDPLNRTLISASLDGTVRLWDFRTGVLQHVLPFRHSSPTALSTYHSSSLIALARDDLSIAVVDYTTHRAIRELWGCAGQISDLFFSPDGKWVIASSMDQCIRVWDLLTGHLVHAMRLPGGPVTAIAISETGEYLATAQAGQAGIQIWNNRTLFTHVPTRLIGDQEIIDAVTPAASGENSEGLLEGAFLEDGVDGAEEGEEDRFAPPSDSQQLSADLQTLSLVPRPRWQTLLYLDAVRARNKPKEPPRAPEKAPFFLSALGRKPQSSQDHGGPIIRDLEKQQPSSRILDERVRSMLDSSSVPSLVPSPDSYNIFLNHLASLAPSAADLLIRSLSGNDLTLFVKALTWRARQRRDYELCQAWMGVFLRLHGADVIKDASKANEDHDEVPRPQGNLLMRRTDMTVDEETTGLGTDNASMPEKGGLGKALREWRDVQVQERQRMGELVGYVKGVIGFLRSART